MRTRTLALAALLAPALSAQAQNAMEDFNPFAMLAPIMPPWARCWFP